MKILRIKAFQPFVCYRKPLSYGFWETFPLPPFSTIRGWVYTILEKKIPEENIHLNIGVVGVHESIVYDMQTLIKFDRVRKEKKQIILKNFNKAFSNTPTYIANITNINLRIYLQMPDDLMTMFQEKIMCPYTYPSLGRFEDLLRIDEVKIIEAQKQECNLINNYKISYGIYLRPDTAKDNGLIVSNFLIPFLYEEIDNIRFFKNREKVIYTDNGYITNGNYYFDEENDDVFNNSILIQLFGNYQQNE